MSPSDYRKIPQTAPRQLRDLNGWLGWNYVQLPGEAKPRKIPHYADGRRRFGKQGAPSDRARLVTFQVARDAAMRLNFDGVGLAMLPDWNMTALDFDNCIDGNGNIHEEVNAVVAGTYAEYSPSGRGIRAFVLGNLGNNKSYQGDRWAYGFETFNTTGFVTFTGRKLRGR